MLPIDSLFPLYKADEAVLILKATPKKLVIRTGDTPVPFPMIARHRIGRIGLDRDTIQIHFLGDEWVKKRTPAGPFSLAHLNLDSDQILTAQTQALRPFVEAHAGDAEAPSIRYKLIGRKQQLHRSAHLT